MGPVRILILAVLLYIGYRLIMKNFSNSDDDEKNGKRAAKGGKLTDVLVEDPICHRLVPKQQAVELETEGETHYFCSQECCDTYRSEQGDDS